MKEVAFLTVLPSFDSLKSNEYKTDEFLAVTENYWKKHEHDHLTNETK